MIRRRWTGFLAVVAAAVLAPASGRAQSVRVEPAETIRVVERSDRWTGDRVREVVADLDADEVLLVQVALVDAGFALGAYTAVLDEATRGALRRFQIERGLTICGCVSYETVVALGIVPRVVEARAAYARSDAGRRRVVVWVPQRRRRHDVGGSGVVVGAGGRTGVYVGHRPARGSGHATDRRPSRPRPVDSVGRRVPVRPRAGGPIRAGDHGGPDRPSRPRPR